MARLDLEGVTKVFGRDVVAVDDLSLAIEDGELLVLVGPSGCGKSTALRLIAGLEECTRGQIRIGDRVVTDLAPKDRDVAMVFQSAATFPYMTVAENMGFGLKLRGRSRREIGAKVKEVATLLGLEEFLDRHPAQLSGGERQRVAIGRAMLREPQVFLMDEPLSSLDARLRLQMRAEIARLHRRLGTTTVYVTHDQHEAMTLGDRVAVLNGGVLEQVDTPETLYRQPATLFVATFIGSPPMNVIDAVIEDHTLSFSHVDVSLSASSEVGTSEVIVGIRPSDLKDVRTLTSTEGLTVIDAVVDAVEHLGSELHVVFALARPESSDGRDLGADAPWQPASAGLFTACLNTDRHPTTGDRIQLAFNSDRLYLFDRKTGRSLRPVGRLETQMGL